MNRMVKQNITLSDGEILPAGARIMVSDDKVNDPTSFPEPAKFDVARFQRLREQPGEENRHQFVTTTSDHMGFGHGQHACPGRFFASNEIKILLCFLLLRYDLRLAGDRSNPTHMMFENAQFSNPSLKVEIRRRREEIDLSNPLSG